MNKEHIIKDNYTFQKIINGNKSFRYKDYIIYVEKNETNEYRFGFSVGKKIGKAVVRNKIKRQLRAIVSKKDYQKGFNCIIIVGSNILNKSYKEMEDNLLVALSKLNLVKEKIDE